MNDDQPRLPYVGLSPDGIAPLQALEHYLNAFSGLERRLLKIVRLRVSLLSRGEFCTRLHRSGLEKIQEPVSLIDAIANWTTSDAFTQRQRAALLWADTMTNIEEDHAPAEKYALLQQHFSDQEMVDLTIATTSINAWNLPAIAFRAQWAPPGSIVGEGVAPRDRQEASATASGRGRQTERLEEAL